MNTLMNHQLALERQREAYSRARRAQLVRALRAERRARRAAQDARHAEQVARRAADRVAAALG